MFAVPELQPPRCALSERDEVRWLAALRDVSALVHDLLQGKVLWAEGLDHLSRAFCSFCDRSLVVSANDVTSQIVSVPPMVFVIAPRLNLLHV